MHTHKIMENNIAFGLKGIEIINSIIKTPEEPRQISVFGFDIQFKTNTNLKENVVSVFVDVKVKDQEKLDQLGQFSALFHYGVDDLEKNVNAKELSHVEIPQHLLSTLLGISTSTLRGLMFGAFKGTFMHPAILPIIDIGALQLELTPVGSN